MYIEWRINKDHFKNKHPHLENCLLELPLTNRCQLHVRDEPKMPNSSGILLRCSLGIIYLFCISTLLLSVDPQLGTTCGLLVIGRTNTK